MPGQKASPPLEATPGAQPHHGPCNRKRTRISGTIRLLKLIHNPPSNSQCPPPISPRACSKEVGAAFTPAPEPPSAAFGDGGLSRGWLAWSGECGQRRVPFVVVRMGRRSGCGWPRPSRWQDGQASGLTTGAGGGGGPTRMAQGGGRGPLALKMNGGNGQSAVFPFGSVALRFRRLGTGHGGGDGKRTRKRTMMGTSMAGMNAVWTRIVAGDLGDGARNVIRGFAPVSTGAVRGIPGDAGAGGGAAGGVSSGAILRTIPSRRRTRPRWPRAGPTKRLRIRQLVFGLRAQTLMEMLSASRSSRAPPMGR